MSASTRTPIKGIKQEYRDEPTPTPSPVSSSTSFGSTFTPHTPPEDEPFGDMDEDEDEGSSKKRKKISTTQKTTPKKKTPSSGGKGKVGAWTSEEDWKMFTMLHPKIASPNWAQIGSAVGRDAKNRYTIMKKRVEGAIKGISGN